MTNGTLLLVSDKEKEIAINELLDCVGKITTAKNKFRAQELLEKNNFSLVITGNEEWMIRIAGKALDRETPKIIVFEKSKTWLGGSILGKTAGIGKILCKEKMSYKEALELFPK